MDVEHFDVRGEGGLDGRDRAAIPSLREVRNGLERQLHGPYSRSDLPNLGRIDRSFQTDEQAGPARPDSGTVSGASVFRL
jgi:hypothetical protein